MIKRSIILFLLLSLGTLFVIYADDDSPEWRVWLHDNNGHLLLVDVNGDVVNDMRLPLSDDYIADSVNVTISPDNRFIAYTFLDSIASEPNILRIYQPETETVHYEIATTIERGFSALVFDSMSNRIAFGVGGVSQNPAMLMIINVNAGTVAMTLNADDFETDDDVNLISPEYFDQNSFVFAGFGTTSMTYQWYFDSEMMIELPNYPILSPRERFDATGEQIAIETNRDFPMADMPNAQNNTLSVYDPVTRSWSPFFTRQLVINEAYFVQNGESILIHGEDDEYDNLWMLIERDGTVVRPLRDIFRRDINGVADGFVYTYRNETRGTTELIHYNTTRLLSDRTVWLDDGIWEIVWVDSGRNGLSGFMPWAQIDDAIYDPLAPTPIVTMEPTSFPSPAPIIYIGREVEVNTIDGEVLYMRDEPSTGGEVVMNLLDRMMLTVIDGPIEVDGYIWWQVVNEDGLEGWAAQAVDDVTTLLPR